MKLKFLLLGAAFSFSAALAQNPFIQTRYTADPAPLVVGDTLYLYADVDEPGADFFWMYQWRVYSTTDMVNWQDHGQAMGFDTFTWADDRAWATQACQRNGKYYWYVCAHSKLSNGMAIGVAVADSPMGPFRDALGKPLYDDGQWDNIDPTVLIDGKKAYLSWGNPRLHEAELNDDMISFKGDVKIGKPGEVEGYTEGPWLSKRGKNYYLLYAAGGVPEHIGYSMSKKPQGPWKQMGTIMPQLNSTNSFTNHCGVVDYKGHSYFFYHTGNLPGGGGFDRSCAVEEFKYNKDGSFPTIMPTREGVKALNTFNPFRVVEAEIMADSKGISTDQNSRCIYVSNINNGDWMKLANVDFSQQQAKVVEMQLASSTHGGSVELRLDSIAGEKIAEVAIGNTGGRENFQQATSAITKTVNGVHDLFFVFRGQKGRELFTIDKWEIK